MAKLSEEEKERRAANRRRKRALEAETDALRREERRKMWVEHGAYLTRAELEAGVNCRGCGLPILDGLGGWPPLLKLTDEERREYEAAEADFKTRHPDCRSHRWSMADSRTAHCGFCCPPPPLSDKQIGSIRAIFERAGRPNPADLDTWQLTLTCDHVVDKTQHHTNTYWSASTVHCPECGQTRGIVISEKPPAAPARRAAEHKRLTTELGVARRELDKHQKRADTARRRLDKLEAEHAAFGLPTDDS